MALTKKVAELQEFIAPDDASAWITNLWTNYQHQRAEKLDQWQEVQEYVFATDTSTTSNSDLPWTHNTTIPKLTQIRDNLHANYISSLFPNDNWLSWEAFSRDAAKKEVAETIESYMANKAREGGLRDVVSGLLYDYIDYGNAIAMPEFEARYKTTDDERTPSFIGPRLIRISPLDIVWNPLATTFEESFKIIRSFSSLGALQKLANTSVAHKFWEDVVKRRKEISMHIANKGYTTDDWNKASQYQVDGFGNLSEYYQSNSVEILEFYGDVFINGELQENRMITVVDRSVVVRNEPIPSYGGEALIRHVGWRKRPDNLIAMGPLDNLIGMQYMIDHYINMGANALDLKIMPPKKIIGEVDEFDWGPNAEIHIDEGGDVQELAQNFGDIFTVKDWIETMEMKMELYAGAPREAMGIRSPGEKTALEVQTLENASSRIFQEKITQFEIFLEKCLNDMLELAHKNFDEEDIVRVIDRDIGVVTFKTITKEDITANGIIRPIGARHFAKKANELQNIMGIFNTPMGQMIAPHTSTKALARFVEDVTDIKAYDIFRENVAIEEQQEMQLLAGQAQEDNDVVGMMSEEQEMAEQALEDEENDDNQVVEGAFG